MTISNEQVVFAPNLYAQGGQIIESAAQVAFIESGAFRDNQNITDIIISDVVALNGDSNGAGGLDTGTIAINTLYYLHAIGSSMSLEPSTYMISTSLASPTLPLGYDTFRWIGVLKTDGSANFLKCYVSGNGNERFHWWDATIVVLLNGTETTLTAVSLATAVPAIDNTQVKLSVSFSPATAADKVSFAPYGSTSTSLPGLSSTVATKAEIAELNVLSKLNSTTPTILYINSAVSAQTTVLVVGFNYTV